MNNDLDIKDFLILSEIYRTKSVSAAVERVGLGQPSISIRLGKLRKHFNDPLFVRTSAGMQATPRLEAIVPSIQNVIELFEGKVGTPQLFEPSSANRTFRICMTDTGQVVILPKLLERLKGIAPSVRIDTVNLGADTARLLEAGEVDTAMGFTQDIPASFYQQQLFEEKFVCMISASHPRIKERLSKSQFLSEKHIEVALPRGTGHWILRKALEDQGLVRDVAVRVPSFLGVARIIRHSELIAIVPYHLARLLAEDDEILLVDPPMSLPGYTVKQYWHERYHRDPANRWLRQLVAELFIE